MNSTSEPKGTAISSLQCRSKDLLHPVVVRTVDETGLVAIVVAIVPIVVVMPAALMFIPPLVALSPAALPGFVQFMAPVVCLPAVVSVVLDGFMELVLRTRGTPVAIVIVAGRARRARKQERGSQRGCGQQSRYEEVRFRATSHLHNILPFFDTSVRIGLAWMNGLLLRVLKAQPR